MPCTSRVAISFRSSVRNPTSDSTTSAQELVEQGENGCTDDVSSLPSTEPEASIISSSKITSCDSGLDPRPTSFFRDHQPSL